MRMRWMAPLLVLPAMLAATHCGGGDDDDSGGSLASLTGVFEGTLESASTGPGALSVALVQSGSALGGAFESDFADPSFNNTGTLTGQVNGDDVTLTLDSADPADCDFTVDAERSGDDDLSGTFTSVGTGCDGADEETGTFDITRVSETTPAATTTPTTTATEAPTPTATATP